MRHSIPQDDGPKRRWPRIVGRAKPVVFVGTAAGANQPFTVEGARTVKSLWGLIAVKLGGWKAYETIKASDEARTNPGSEAMIAILKQAAPCLVLLDEVVAYSRNLEGIPYDGFVSFLQSLTEAANAVPGVLVVGSLPESGPEVGDQRGREALLALEKVFGPVQSAWTPAQGISSAGACSRSWTLKARRLASRPSRRSRATTGTMRASSPAARATGPTRRS
jgi:hypothetical protein